MPPIEFVPDRGPEGIDEELPGSPATRPRRAILLAAGVVALLTLGVTVRAVSSDGGGSAPTPTAQAAGSRTPSTTPSAVADQPAPRQIGCSAAGSCTTTAAVPAALVTLLRGAFPQLGAVRSTSQVITVGLPKPTLWSRRLSASSRELTIRVEMHVATDFDDPKTARVPAGPANPSSVVYARTLGRGLSITVSVLGPLAQLPTIATVQRLATDRRLLAID